MSTKEFSAVAPFHLQAEELGGYLESEREREREEAAKCLCGREGCPDCNTD
jgi:hypothetical protein